VREFDPETTDLRREPNAMTQDPDHLPTRGQRALRAGGTTAMALVIGLAALTATASESDLVRDIQRYCTVCWRNARLDPGLSPRQDRIVELWTRGWSVPEIGESLGLPVARVSDEKYKALRKLENHLAGRRDQLDLGPPHETADDLPNRRVG
jgi:DNA-binding NarL/FixJ family response regulator